MHHLSRTLTDTLSLGFFPWCQGQVRFSGLIELSRMLRRLCGPPSIPLSFSLAAVLPRRDTQRVSYGTADVDKSATPSVQRLQRGLPGYLILFAPHAFAPQRRYRPREPPSLLVFLPISAHFTATPGIPFSSTGPKPQQYRPASQG